eukprot:TRINITY_DN795_c1_g1_i1.p1 TRINITY_DN795_c1_g1~~TRINITY_DN795_c1_g1_i1.p1  ORF type:complete len:2409 (-),score=564.29 TRINITY_DN795_c1_g1_i1:120-7346(-)
MASTSRWDVRQTRSLSSRWAHLLLLTLKRAKFCTANMKPGTSSVFPKGLAASGGGNRFGLSDLAGVGNVGSSGVGGVVGLGGGMQAGQSAKGHAPPAGWLTTDVASRGGGLDLRIGGGGRQIDLALGKSSNLFSKGRFGLGGLAGGLGGLGGPLGGLGISSSPAGGLRGLVDGLGASGGQARRMLLMMANRRYRNRGAINPMMQQLLARHILQRAPGRSGHQALQLLGLGGALGGAGRRFGGGFKQPRRTLRGGLGFFGALGGQGGPVGLMDALGLQGTSKTEGAQLGDASLAPETLRELALNLHDGSSRKAAKQLWGMKKKRQQASSSDEELAIGPMGGDRAKQTAAKGLELSGVAKRRRARERRALAKVPKFLNTDSDREREDSPKKGKKEKDREKDPNFIGAAARLQRRLERGSEQPTDLAGLNSRRRRRQTIVQQKDALQQAQKAGKVSMLKMFMEDSSAAKGPPATMDLEDIQESLQLKSMSRTAAERKRSPASHSDTSSSLESETSSGISAEEKPVILEEDKVWYEVDDVASQRTLLLLRSCKDRLVQRFGSVDKAYLKCTPVVVGLTYDVFVAMVSQMGCGDEDAVLMFRLMRQLLPTRTSTGQRKRERAADAVGGHSPNAAATKRGAARRLRTGLSMSDDKQGSSNFSRVQFSDAMRSIVPVSSLTQLRLRLRKHHANPEAAFAAMDTAHKGVVTAEIFRDFLASAGVGAAEARSLFLEMQEHDERERKTQRQQAAGEPRPLIVLPLERPTDLSRHGFVASLLHTEALCAAAKVRHFLLKQQSLAHEVGEGGRHGSRIGAIRGSTAMLHRPSQEQRASSKQSADGAKTPPQRKRRRSSDARSRSKNSAHGESSRRRRHSLDAGRGRRSSVGGGRRGSSAGLSPGAGAGRRRSISAEASRPSMLTPQRRGSIAAADAAHSSGGGTAGGTHGVFHGGVRGSTGWLRPDMIPKGNLLDTSDGEQSHEPKEAANAALGRELDKLKDLYNAFMLVAGKKHVASTAISEAEFEAAAKEFKLDHDELHSLFRLGYSGAHSSSGPSNGAGGTLRRPLQDIAARIVAGLGHRHDAFREHCGLPAVGHALGHTTSGAPAQVGLGGASGAQEGTAANATRRGAAKPVRRRHKANAGLDGAPMENGTSPVASSRKTEGGASFGLDIGAAALGASAPDSPKKRRGAPETMRPGMSRSMTLGAQRQRLRRSSTREARAAAAAAEAAAPVPPAPPDENPPVDRGAEASAEDNGNAGEESAAETSDAGDGSPKDSSPAKGAKLLGRSFTSVAFSLMARSTGGVACSPSAEAGTSSGAGTGTPASGNKKGWDRLRLRQKRQRLQSDGQKDGEADGAKSHEMKGLQIGAGLEQKHDAGQEKETPGTPTHGATIGLPHGSANKENAAIAKRQAPLVQKKATRLGTVHFGHDGDRQGAGPEKEADEVGGCTPRSLKRRATIVRSQASQGPGGLELFAGTAPAGVDADAGLWGFKEEEEDPWAGEGSGANHGGADAGAKVEGGGEDAHGGGASPRSPEEETKTQLQERGSIEQARHERRLLLFDGDLYQLESATRALRDFRARLLARFKTKDKAFSDLAGGHDAVLDLKALQEKMVRFLKFNPLDTDRMLQLVDTIEETKLDYAAFLRVLRFAEPMTCLQRLRAHLVMRYGTVADALRAMKLDSHLEREISVDVFERHVIGAGVISSDARALFRTMAAARTRGTDHCASAFLTPAGIRLCIDYAQVFGWLEALHGRLGSHHAARAAFAHLRQSVEAVATPAALAAAAARLGFPERLAPPLWALLERCGAAPEAALQRLEDIMLEAFDEAAPAKAGPLEKLPGPSDSVRQAALAITTQLRRHAKEKYADYKLFFGAFRAKRAEDGITLDEWEEARQAIGFTDSERWRLVFGHMVDWHHPVWDSKSISNPGRVTLQRLAKSLEASAPCRTLSSLRQHIMEKFGQPAKAWTVLAGKENAEDVSHAQWQRWMLRQLSIAASDANHLFAMVRVAAGADQGSAADVRILHRAAFLNALRPLACGATGRMLGLLLRHSHEPISCAFEADYPREPVPLATFESCVCPLLNVAPQDAKVMFAYLDANNSGFLRIDQLLDALTMMQAAYLPPPAASKSCASQVVQLPDDAHAHTTGSRASLQLLGHRAEDLRSAGSAVFGHASATTASAVDDGEASPALAPSLGGHGHGVLASLKTKASPHNSPAQSRPGSPAVRDSPMGASAQNSPQKSSALAGHAHVVAGSPHAGVVPDLAGWQRPATTASDVAAAAGSGASLASARKSSTGLPRVATASGQAAAAAAASPRQSSAALARSGTMGGAASARRAVPLPPHLRKALTSPDRGSIAAAAGHIDFHGGDDFVIGGPSGKQHQQQPALPSLTGVNAAPATPATPGSAARPSRLVKQQSRKRAMT